MTDQPSAQNSQGSGGRHGQATKLGIRDSGAINGNSRPDDDPKSRRTLRDIIVKTEFWLATGTWALVVVTWIIVGDARTAVERSQRAWLAPKTMILAGPIPSDGTLDVAVLVEDDGREPATGVIWNLSDPILVDLLPETGDTYNQGPPQENTSCNNLKTSDARGAVIYPFVPGPMKDWIPMGLPNDATTKMVVAAAKALNGSMFVDGCLAYRTTGAQHTSRFRFLWRSVHGESPERWNFQSATTGSHAD